DLERRQRIPPSRGAALGHARAPRYRRKGSGGAPWPADAERQPVAPDGARAHRRRRPQGRRQARRAESLQGARRRSCRARRVAVPRRGNGRRARSIDNLPMNRREFGALLLASTAAGCGLFGGDKKTPLPGERISVLGLDRRVAPDPALANLGVTLPRPVVNPDWPEPGGYPNHAMYHLGLPPSLTRAWETSVGDGSSRYRKVMSQPIIVRDTVFAMDGGTQLSAVAAGNGSSIWQVELKPEGMKGNAFGGGPAFWKDRLYVATGYAEVLALDPANGNVIWRKPVDAPVHAAPTVADGRIYAVTVENELIVLATEDGRRLWTHNGIPETAGLLGGASPAVEGEIVVVAYNSGELFALRVENGRVLWSENLAAARNVDPVSGLAD